MRQLKLIIAALFLISPFAANADVINYVFEGTGSGSIDGTNFADVNISFVLVGDTGAVTVSGNVFLNDIVASMIDVDGFSTASFTTAGLRMFMNSGNNALGFGDDAHADLLDIQDAALAGYDLTTAIGPIFEPNPFAFNQFLNVSTTQGLMTLTNVNFVTFEANVPEPGTLALLGLGLVGLAARRRRKV